METNTLTPDRVKLPFTFDPQKLMEETAHICKGAFEYYKVIQLRAPAHFIDPSLPLPPPADDYADGSWTEWMDAPILSEAPYMKSIIDHFDAHTKVTLIRLLRLAPGAVIAPHTDPTLGLEIEKSVIRLTIPIQNDPEMQFLLNGTHVPMQVGECWYMRLTDPHSVINTSEEERINLTIDMIPNEWVRECILNAAK